MWWSAVPAGTWPAFSLLRIAARGKVALALVVFTDSRGVTWRVWNITTESLRRSDYLEPEYKTGWLCFESEATGERRRLTGAPADWMTLPAERLDLLARMATPGTRRPPRERESAESADSPGAP